MELPQKLQCHGWTLQNTTYKATGGKAQKKTMKKKESAVAQSPASSSASLSASAARLVDRPAIRGSVRAKRGHHCDHMLVLGFVVLSIAMRNAREGFITLKPIGLQR
jgi:hypothetical protein